MKVHIGNYILESLDEGFTTYRPAVVKKGKSKGMECKNGQGYFGTLKSACNNLLNVLISDSDASTIEELKQIVIDAKCEIIQAAETIK